MEFADVTYRDFVEQIVIKEDKERKGRYGEMYNQYRQNMADSLWTKFLSIVNDVKTDTELNTRAKAYLEMGQEYSYAYFKNREKLCLRVNSDSSDTNVSDVKSFGGYIVKTAKSDEKDVALHYFSVIQKKPNN